MASIIVWVNCVTGLFFTNSITRLTEHYQNAYIVYIWTLEWLYNEICFGSPDKGIKHSLETCTPDIASWYRKLDQKDFALLKQRRQQNGSPPLKYSTAFTTLIIFSEWLLKAGSAWWGHTANLAFLQYHPGPSAITGKKQKWLLKALPASHVSVQSFTSGRGYSRRRAGCQTGNFVWGGRLLVHETVDPVAFCDRLLEDRATGFDFGSFKMENLRGKEARFPN